MGAFYGNITIKGPSQQKVAEALQGRRAIVTPNIGDYTVVFDSVCDAQDIGGIQALASRLSGEFRCFVLAVIIHDDDVFVFFLYQDGKLRVLRCFRWSLRYEVGGVCWRRNRAWLLDG